jgi:hypothetical protein
MFSRLLALHLGFSRRQPRSISLICSALLCAVLQSAWAESPCDPRVLLPSTNPAYADAMELAGNLRGTDSR